MKLSLIIMGRISAIFLVFSGLNAGEESPRLRNLKLPVERYEDGKIKAQIVAGTAVIPPEGRVEASEVRLEFYGRDGSLESLMTTASCVFDRDAGKLTSESPVRLEKPGWILTGTGFECDTSEQKVNILRDVRVEIERPLKWPSEADGDEEKSEGSDSTHAKSGRSAKP